MNILKKKGLIFGILILIGLFSFYSRPNETSESNLSGRLIATQRINNKPNIVHPVNQPTSYKLGINSLKFRFEKPLKNKTKINFEINNQNSIDIDYKKSIVLNKESKDFQFVFEVPTDSNQQLRDLEITVSMKGRDIIFRNKKPISEIKLKAPIIQTEEENTDANYSNEQVTEDQLTEEVEEVFPRFSPRVVNLSGPIDYFERNEFEATIYERNNLPGIEIKSLVFKFYSNLDLDVDSIRFYRNNNEQTEFEVADIRVGRTSPWNEYFIKVDINSIANQNNGDTILELRGDFSSGYPDEIFDRNYATVTFDELTYTINGENETTLTGIHGVSASFDDEL